MISQGEEIHREKAIRDTWGSIDLARKAIHLISFP